MNHLRLDKAVRAKVLSVRGNEVMIDAFWPASKRDHNSFSVHDGIAHNIVCVSKEYFQQKYGIVV